MAIFIPTLCFHSVSSSQSHDIYTFDYRKFDRLLAKITSKYKTISLNQISSISESLTSPSVLITFDDGYEDLLRYALPILVKYNVKALFFLLPKYLGKSNLWDCRSKVLRQHMSKSQVKELIANMQNIGSHGVSHNSLVKFDRARVRFELKHSKMELENAFGVTIESLAYPYGDFNYTTRLVAKSIYKYSFATDNGDPVWHKFVNNSIKRISIRGNQSISEIMNMVANYNCSRRKNG